MIHPKRLQVITIGSNPEEIRLLQESVRQHYQDYARKWRDKGSIMEDDLSCPSIEVIALDKADWQQVLEE